MRRLFKSSKRVNNSAIQIGNAVHPSFSDFFPRVLGEYFRQIGLLLLPSHIALYSRFQVANVRSNNHFIVLFSCSPKLLLQSQTNAVGKKAFLRVKTKNSFIFDEDWNPDPERGICKWLSAWWSTKSSWLSIARLVCLRYYRFLEKHMRNSRRFYACHQRKE